MTGNGGNSGVGSGLSKNGKRGGRRIWLWLGGSVAGLLLVVFLLLLHFIGGPKDIYGFLRYALPEMREGNLRVGDRAPDARLYSLDGKHTFHLHDVIGKRPLVLIFGSYT